jgi:hypothetical protein
MGIAQRGSNRSNGGEKREKDSGKRDADRPICQRHQDPIESKWPLPDRRQMHALNGCFGVEAKRWGCAVIVNVHKTRRFGDHVFTNTPCLL